MFREDNNGFVLFPYGERVNKNEGGRTLVYLVAFESNRTKLSNTTLISPGDFVSDDVVDRLTSNDIIKNELLQNEYNNTYFPDNSHHSSIIVNRITSIPFVSTICIGWSDDSYEYLDRPWKATYRDLTEEGKRIYYSIKKLHNSKEIRILTFNNI